MRKHPFLLLLLYLYLSCQAQVAKPKEDTSVAALPSPTLQAIPRYDTTAPTIHVFVALCDNKFQGIVPVPAAIGNGKDPDRNLYWGCGNGIRTYFKKSAEWTFLKSSKVDSIRLERLVFRHKTKNYYLVADAYDGEYIRSCTKEFLAGCAGQLTDTLQIDQKVIGIGGHAALLAYVGHNGLMDFQLQECFENSDGKQRDCMILACYSKKYFAPHLQATKADPLLWTSGLMCPEAYTLHDALSGYVNRESQESIRMRAARAYSSHLQCSVKAARNLLPSGW